MGTKILAIVTLLLAVAVAAVSFLLFQQSKALRSCQSMLAKTTLTIAQKSDNQSNTNVASKVSFSPKTDTAKESGNLSFTSFLKARKKDGDKVTYPDYERNLQAVVEQIVVLNEQRNALAENIHSMITTLSLPGGQIGPENLKDLSDKELWVKNAKIIADHLNALVARDNEMIKTLSTISTVVEYKNFNLEHFKNRQQNGEEYTDFAVSSDLNTLAKMVSGMKDRSVEYANTLYNIIDVHINAYKFTTDKEDFKDPKSYERALLDIINDMDNINEMLVKYKVLAEQKIGFETKHKELISQLEAKKLQIVKLNKNLDTLNEEVITLRENLPDPTWQPEANLEGRVLQVDNDYGFVILSLTKKQIRPGFELVVASKGAKRISARVRVVKVTEDYCQADILPVARRKNIKVGDRVLLSVRKTPVVESVSVCPLCNRSLSAATTHAVVATAPSITKPATTVDTKTEPEQSKPAVEDKPTPIDDIDLSDLDLDI